MHDMVHVSKHPLSLDKLMRLRDQATRPSEFRKLVADLAVMIFLDATHHVHTTPTLVRTPLAECEGRRISDRIGLFPILRAGLGMAEAILQFVPDAHVWHLGLFRDHETLKPVTYYNKLPEKPGLDFAV